MTDSCETNRRSKLWPGRACDQRRARRRFERLQRMADVHRDARTGTIGNDNHANRRQTRHHHDQRHRRGKLPHRMPIEHERSSHRLALIPRAIDVVRDRSRARRRAHCTGESDGRRDRAGTPTTECSDRSIVLARAAQIEQRQYLIDLRGRPVRKQPSGARRRLALSRSSRVAPGRRVRDRVLSKQS